MIFPLQFKTRMELSQNPQHIISFPSVVSANSLGDFRVCGDHIPGRLGTELLKKEKDLNDSSIKPLEAYCDVRIRGEEVMEQWRGLRRVEQTEL